MDGADRPVRHGQLQDLTAWYDATDSMRKENEVESYRVHGRIVRVSETDNVASDHFLEEVLKWTLCVESKVKNSHDTAVQPIKASNVRDFMKRFPGAFDEYEKMYRNFGLPTPGSFTSNDFGKGLLGEYKKPESLPAPYVDVATRKAQLLRELAKLDGVTPDEVNEVAGAINRATPATMAQIETVPEYLAQTLISDFKDIPAKARDKLAANGFATVGHLATITDAEAAELGAGQWHKWRVQASNAINGSLMLQAVA